MNIQSLKIELISWLGGLNDKKLLESLFSVKQANEAGDWYSELSDEQKLSLERGIEDHKNGRYLTSEQFLSRYEKKEKPG